MRGTDADSDNSTMRDDFEAALVEVEGSAPTQAAAEPLEPPQSAAEPQPPASGSDEMPEAQPQAAESASAPPAAGSDEINPQEADSKDSLKAPVDWSPKEREDWSRIPRHLQDKIMQRERDIADNIANTRQARQVYDNIQQLGTKYGSVMAAEGVNDPMQAINGLFDTVAGLRLGNQQDKAQIVANMIQHYGVDVKALDGVLSQRIGGNPAANSTNAQEDAIQRAIDARMAPFMQQMSAQQAHQQQAVQHAAQQQVQQFSQKAEFLNDVREDMADLIDLAAKRGREMPLAEAYSKACMANPEIVKIMSDRQRQAELQGNQTAIQQKQHAASSINGRQSGTGGNAGAVSIRDQLEAAWNDTGY
jgi:hypothetical protein